MTYNFIVTAILAACISISISYGIVSAVKLILFAIRKRRIIYGIKSLGSEYCIKYVWKDITSISFVLDPDGYSVYFNIIFQPDDPSCLVYANGKFFGTVTTRTAIERIKKIKEAISTANRHIDGESND